MSTEAKVNLLTCGFKDFKHDLDYRTMTPQALYELEELQLGLKAWERNRQVSVNLKRDIYIKLDYLKDAIKKMKGE
jgi:hypothetical protein